MKELLRCGLAFPPSRLVQRETYRFDKRLFPKSQDPLGYVEV
jgi:hypothetical protein